MKLNEIFDDMGFFDSTFESHKQLIKFRDALDAVRLRWLKEGHKKLDTSEHYEGDLLIACSGEILVLTGEPEGGGNGYLSNVS